MTGLPQSVVNKVIQKKSSSSQNTNELKFKMKNKDSIETQSVMSNHTS
jgi:DNA recombination-dependent growth factor C